MLTTLGRGLAPMQNKIIAPFRKFNLTNTLPPEFGFSRASKATCRNATGKLIIVESNQPRFDHTAEGKVLGLVIEPSATNKCVFHNVNPTSTSGLTTSGTGVLSVVDDTAELLAAGLDQICTNGKVYKAQATTASAFTVSINGTTGNTSKHSISLFARGVSGTGTTGKISLGGTALNIATAGGHYQKFKHENRTPDSSSRKFTIIVNGNRTLYFILNQLEQSTFCSSIIPVSGSAVTRPTDRAFILNIDTYNWFDEAQGYMMVRYSHKRFIGADGYAAVLHNNGSSNTIGLRITNSDKSLRGFVRANSSNQHTSANGDTQIINALISAGIRWNATDCDILSGGKSFNSAFTLMPTGIQSLEIGARNSGINPINGYVSYIEIGTREMSLKQLGQKIQTQTDDYVVGAGQSLIRGYFYSKADNSQGGKQKFREVIGGANLENAFVILDGTTGSSAACKTTDNTNYWWDNATSTNGPAFDNFFTAINSVGGKPNAILWGQGEEDCHTIGVNTTAAQYKEAVLAVFAKMRQSLGNIPIYIQGIGQRTSFSNTGGIQTVRDIQKELVAENVWCDFATEIYDLPLFDAVHLSNSSFVIAAQRNALALMNVAGALGPVITTATRSGTTLTVNIAHDNGSDFTPNSGIEGFKFFDDTSEITISSAVKTNATTITLTLASAPTSGTETLYYGYDAMIGLNISNVVKDNAPVPMPLRTAKILLS